MKFCIINKVIQYLQLFKKDQKKVKIQISNYYYITMIKKSFRIFAVPLFADNYSYIIQTSLKQPLLLVDPANPSVIVDCLNKYFVNQNVGHILYTHKHWDHAGGAQQLFKTLRQKDEKLQVWSGSEDAPHIKTVTQSIEKDWCTNIGKIKANIYKVPCHTRGHVIYHLLHSQSPVDFQLKDEIKNQMQTSEGKKIRVFQQPQCAFSGDTLFCGGIGRFFQGNAPQMLENITKISKNIGKNCSIYNGHEYTLQNLKWAAEVQPQNQKISNLIAQIQLEDPSSVCTLPTSVGRQSQINLFYKAVISNENKLGVAPVEYLGILRQAKNKNSSNLNQFKAQLGHI